MERKDGRSQIAKFMGPTWGPPGSCRPQMGPTLAPWTLISGVSQQLGWSGTCHMDVILVGRQYFNHSDETEKIRNWGNLLSDPHPRTTSKVLTSRFITDLLTSRCCVKYQCYFLLRVDYCSRLTHWDRVTHICVSKLCRYFSDNGLSPVHTKPLSEIMLAHQLGLWEQI